MARNYARTAQTTNAEALNAAQAQSWPSSGLASSSVSPDTTNLRESVVRGLKESIADKGSPTQLSPTIDEAVQQLPNLMSATTGGAALRLPEDQRAKLQDLIVDLKTGSGSVSSEQLTKRLLALKTAEAFTVRNGAIEVRWEIKKKMESGSQTQTWDANDSALKKLIKLDLGAAVTSQDSAIRDLGLEEARARTEKSRRDSATLKEYYAGGGSPETRARLRQHYSPTPEEKAREQIETYRAKTGWQEGGRTGYAARVDNAVKTARAVGRTYGAEAAGERLTQGLNTVHNVTAPESTPYTRSTGVKARDTALLERADQGVQRAEATYGKKLNGLGINHDEVVAILGNGTLGNDVAQAMRIQNAIRRHNPQSAVTTDQALDLVTSYNEYARRYNDYEAQKVRYETVYGNRAPVTPVAATPTAEERAGANVNRAAQSQDRFLQRIGLSQESFTARFAGLPPNFYDLKRAEQISQLKEILGRERRTPLSERYVGEVLDATVTWNDAYQEYLAVQKRTLSRRASAA